MFLVDCLFKTIALIISIVILLVLITIIFLSNGSLSVSFRNDIPESISYDSNNHSYNEGYRECCFIFKKYNYDIDRLSSIESNLRNDIDTARNASYIDKPRILTIAKVDKKHSLNIRYSLLSGFLYYDFKRASKVVKANFPYNKITMKVPLHYNGYFYPSLKECKSFIESDTDKNSFHSNRKLTKFYAIFEPDHDGKRACFEIDTRYIEELLTSF